MVLEKRVLSPDCGIKPVVKSLNFKVEILSFSLIQKF